MARTRWHTVPVLAILVPAATGEVNAQTGTPNAKIAGAVTAAPPSIGDKATIMDWPATHGAQPIQLRAGTNGWVCFPDMPDTQGNDPMCLDEVWLNFANAWMGKTQPKVSRVSIGYMIAPGGGQGSNTDPYATGPTADNEWALDPPHLMILVPDAGSLEWLPTTRESGGPWVTWKGTPYAHIMAPVPAQQQQSKPTPENRP